MSVFKKVLFLISVLALSFTTFAADLSLNYPAKHIIDMPTFQEESADKPRVSVPHKVQHEDMWCWAAVSALVVDHFTGNGAEDCDTASVVKHTNCCAQRQSVCLTPGSVVDINNIFRYFGLTGRHIPGQSNFNQVAYEIGTNEVPVIIQLTSRVSSVGHFIVVSGYEAAGQVIYVNDPLRAGLVKMRFSDLGAYGPGGNLYWTGSFLPVSK